MIHRGEIWWASLPEPVASEPGYRRPLLIIQSDQFNRSKIATVLGIVLTTNTGLAEAPGNVLLPSEVTGLPRDSVVNVSQVMTADKSFLTDFVSKLPSRWMLRVENGLRIVLSL